MIKVGLISFLMVVCPMVCHGDMVGFIGDTRRYVTNTEKTQFPYNTVVRFDEQGNTGTGTFVSDDVILTCRHVVDDVGVGQVIDYYTSDGKKHMGYVAAYPSRDDSLSDFAIVVDENAFSGRVLELADAARTDNNLMMIGYDSLKPLSDSELGVIKKIYRDWLAENGKITPENAMRAIVEIELVLKENYACNSPGQQDCVNCADDDMYCIFNDDRNMKVREGCGIINASDSRIHTDCPGAPGASGAALISSDRNTILGINCHVVRPQIAQELNATSTATRPEVYYKVLQSWIKGLNEQ